MEERTKVIVDRIVPEIGPVKTVRKAIFLEDIIDYEEFTEDDLAWTKIFISGETILIDMSFDAFNEMYEDSITNSNLGLR